MALNFLQLRNLITAYLTPSSEVDKVTASELRAVENAVVDRMESDLSYQGTVNNAFVEALEAVASGSPKGSYADESALIADDPDHAYIYVTIDSGKWYYYNTTLEAWTIGGDYQAPLDIVGELGTSESKVINQKKVSEELVNKLSIIAQTLNPIQKEQVRANINAVEDIDIESMDFAIMDEIGNAILYFLNGKMHVGDSNIVEEIENFDFAIYDPNGFAIATCLNGVWQFSNITVNTNPYLNAKNYGKTCGVFSGSVGSIANSDFAKQIWIDNLNLDISTYGVGGGGMSIKSFNTDLAGETYTSRNTSMPMQVLKHARAVAAETDTAKDIYVIWNSTNDFWNQIVQSNIGLTIPVEIGNVNDAITTSLDAYDEYTLTKSELDSEFGESELTVCAGLQYMIKTLLEINPLAEIYVFTPMRSFATQAAYDPTFEDVNYTHNLKEYVTAMEQVCEKYGVAMLDQYRLWGVNDYNKSQYFGNVLSTPDWTHPLQSGYEKIGYIQMEFLANGK